MLRLHTGLLILAMARCGPIPSKEPEAGDGRAGSGVGDDPTELNTLTPADRSEQDEIAPAEVREDGPPAGAAEVIRATTVSAQDIFTSTLVVVEENATVVSIFKNDSPTPLFTEDVSNEFCYWPYLLLETAENRNDVITLRVGCIVGEDKKSISGKVIVFIATADTLTSVWSGTEITRILRDECWDESFIEVVSSAERIVRIIRVTRKEDHVTDPAQSEFDCPTAPLEETLTKTILP